jgi:hypothetical protein
MLLLSLAPALLVAQEDAAEIAPQDKPKPKKKDAGPRALGWLEIASSGRGTVIPIAILVDGKFYDASAYKATPAPLALEPGTIYEGMRAGNPQGLLTIAAVTHSDAINTKYPWLGKGTWLAEGSTIAKTSRKAETTPLGLESKDEPPRLSKTPANQAAQNAPAPPGTSQAQSVAPTSAAPQGKHESTAPAKKVEPESKPANASGDNAIRLRRGKPSEPLPEDENEPHGVLQTMLAISDADEREPLSFQYAWDKTEREAREKQMDSLAQDVLRVYIKSHANAAGSGTKAVSLGTPTKHRPASKAVELPLEKVSLIACDVWRGNQPVLIYSAEAEASQEHSVNQRPDAGTSSHYFLTIVARSDIYGKLKQLFAQVTDQQHLDVTPRLEFLDAIDADGDSRGELVFRETADSASGYVIYKPGADSLWKMFDSMNLQ